MTLTPSTGKTSFRLKLKKLNTRSYKNQCSKGDCLEHSNGYCFYDSTGYRHVVHENMWSIYLPDIKNNALLYTAVHIWQNQLCKMFSSSRWLQCLRIHDVICKWGTWQFKLPCLLIITLFYSLNLTILIILEKHLPLYSAFEQVLLPGYTVLYKCLQ